MWPKLSHIHLTGAFRHEQVQLWVERTLSLETDLTIFKAEAGVWEEVRRCSSPPRGEVACGDSWKAFDELLFLAGMFINRFCLRPLTSSLKTNINQECRPSAPICSYNSQDDTGRLRCPGFSHSQVVSNVQGRGLLSSLYKTVSVLLRCTRHGRGCYKK